MLRGLVILFIALTLLIGQRNELKVWGKSNVINQFLMFGRPSYAAVLRSKSRYAFRFHAE
jgi:hypothetical protein